MDDLEVLNHQWNAIKAKNPAVRLGAEIEHTPNSLVFTNYSVAELVLAWNAGIHKIVGNELKHRVEKRLESSISRDDWLIMLNGLASAFIGKRKNELRFILFGIDEDLVINYPRIIAYFETSAGVDWVNAVQMMTDIDLGPLRAPSEKEVAWIARLQELESSDQPPTSSAQKVLHERRPEKPSVAKRNDFSLPLEPNTSMAEIKTGGKVEETETAESIRKYPRERVRWDLMLGVVILIKENYTTFPKMTLAYISRIDFKEDGDSKTRLGSLKLTSGKTVDNIYIVASDCHWAEFESNNFGTEKPIREGDLSDKNISSVMFTLPSTRHAQNAKK